MTRGLIFMAMIMASVLMLAQVPGRTIIEGEVMDSMFVPVPFVHVLVSGRNEGGAGDLYGNFKLAVFPGDILIFSSVSFKTDSIRIPDTLTAERYRIKVILTADTVLLSEVTIHPWPDTYKKFREEFLALDAPEYSVEALSKIFRKEQFLYLFEITPGAMPGPASFLYSLLGKGPRQERRLQAEMERDRIQEVMFRRCHPTRIARLTGITDEEEMIRFLKSCNLSVPFILHASDYDLYATISDCYKHYKIPNPQ